jgi:hypothetical protein
VFQQRDFSDEVTSHASRDHLLADTNGDVPPQEKEEFVARVVLRDENTAGPTIDAGHDLRDPLQPFRREASKGRQVDEVVDPMLVEMGHVHLASDAASLFELSRPPA